MDEKASARTQRRTPAQEQTRRLVLDASARLFRERGYASTSLRDIAAATGLKAGSLYYHFSSKEELAEEVLSQGIALVEDRVRGAIVALPRDVDPLDTIRAAMLAHLQALHERGDYASANIRCYGHVPDDMKKRLRKVRATYEELWAGLVEEARAAGRLRDGIDPLALRFSLIGMMNWTLEWRKAGGPRPERLAEQFFAIVFEGAAMHDAGNG